MKITDLITKLQNLAAVNPELKGCIRNEYEDGEINFDEVTEITFGTIIKEKFKNDRFEISPLEKADCILIS